MDRGEQHQARILTIHLLCEEIPHAGALGLLQWEAHPVHEHLLEILLRAHLVNFEAITRRHGGAERDVLLHKLRAHGRCYGLPRRSVLRAASVRRFSLCRNP